MHTTCVYFKFFLLTFKRNFPKLVTFSEDIWHPRSRECVSICVYVCDWSKQKWKSPTTTTCATSTTPTTTRPWSTSWPSWRPDRNVTTSVRPRGQELCRRRRGRGLLRGRPLSPIKMSNRLPACVIDVGTGWGELSLATLMR